MTIKKEIKVFFKEEQNILQIRVQGFPKNKQIKHVEHECWWMAFWEIFNSNKFSLLLADNIQNSTVSIHVAMSVKNEHEPPPKFELSLEPIDNFEGWTSVKKRNSNE